MATETELKLAVRAEHLPALMRMLEARAMDGGGFKSAMLCSTYFDTADQALRREGLVLRVRESAGQYIQTVKSAGAGFGDDPGAMLARGEWEDRTGGAAPDPSAAATGRFLRPELAGRLTPLFRTEVARDTLVLSPLPGTSIEAAIDRGRIEAFGNGAGEPVSEVELECTCGDPAALYDVSLELLAVAPVRLEWCSKSDRGYRLALAAAPTVAAVHAGPVRLDRDLDGHEALRRIGQACLHQIVRNEAAVLAGLPDGIHQMRVGIRRLRAVLAAFGPMLEGAQRRWASNELRLLANALGAARNIDVFDTELVASARDALGNETELARLNAAIATARAGAYSEAASAVRGTRYVGLVLRLLRWLDCRGWRRPDRPHPLDAPAAEIAGRVLDRLLDSARRRGAGFDRQSPAERHDLRIALKKLRYAADLLGDLYDPGDVARFLRPIKQLQDDLGRANDLSAAREVVALLARASDDPDGIAAAGKAVFRWHEPRRAKGMGKARKHLARLFERKPFWKS